ncbi:carboxypeptidase-like regulatory domain-containing protein [Winogradskyella eximia]|uniref:carboxypeptidase-like regulatory domain-containing protein n=1 Tax=Winogradskyella eximia TaxID=262006 RepID=UPI0024908501|nr:carboxypeptidase-like regulatory domain-containing protein [Winogradskyella eximia]
MKKISLLLLLVSINLLNSQTINGIVKDSVTGENIAFANIVLKNGKGTYSDEFGVFQLEIKNFTTDTLKISNLGYESKILALINLKNATKFEVELKPKVENLEEVLISSKKIKYTDKELLGDKKEGNIGVTSLIGYETAIFIDNPKEINGKLKRIYIDLKKRKNAEYIATLNIKIYELDSINNKPGKLLYNENLYVKPKNKKYRLWLDVKDFNIAFPKNGVFIGVEMVNTFGKVKKYAKFGPMFRYTINKDRNARTWSNYHNSGWKGSSIEHTKFKRVKTGISNPMIGIEVLYPKQ